MPNVMNMSGVLLLAAVLCSRGVARERADLVVDGKGGTPFRTIQSALDAVPDTNRVDIIILVRDGVYNEKLFITRSHIAIVGENRDSTRIILPVLREDWVREHGTDWGSGVVNIDSTVTDVTLANMTIYNNYGWETGVFNKHQFTIRGNGTRISLLYCTIISDGGDAVSLWNKQQGMYYHAYCSFEGWVDYVCPRAWCHITNSTFFGHNKTASIWHDGSANPDQKFVIVRSSFDGVPGFPLGRNHHDGQYFLIDCRFSSRMADKAIYYPAESPNARPWIWGDRQYYFNCHRDGGDYGWFRNNLEQAKGSPSPEQITARWTFGGRWDPEGMMKPVLPFATFPTPREGAELSAGTSITLAWLPGRNADSHAVYFGTSASPALLTKTNAPSVDVQVRPGMMYYWRVDELTEEGVVRGDLWSFAVR